MMRTVTDYADATAFERFALERYASILGDQTTDSVDLTPRLAGEPIVRTLTAFIDMAGQGQKTLLAGPLLPLLFGAAWKLLDLLLELALTRAGQVRPQWSIRRKVTEARHGSGDATLLTSDTMLWQALLLTYAATEEHRHCLVHRRARFDGSPLQLHGLDKQGNPLQPLTQSELDAFIQAAQLAAHGVLAGGLRAREERHLRYLLDRLSLHTQAPTLGGQAPHAPLTALLRLEPDENGCLEVDFGWIEAQLPEVIHYGRLANVRIELPDGRALLAYLEETPRQAVRLRLDEWPAYLRAV